MGELIKNLNPISIGNSSLMIELNEGYVKEEGRLIHIQNKHFRYLLPENDFIRFAASVLRAKEEMNYVRGKISETIDTRITPAATSDFARENKVARSVCDIFEKLNIKYRLIEIRNDVCNFIVEYETFNKRFKDIAGIKQTTHPYSEGLGYTYLYQMHPFELYKADNILIEIYFELPCYSLTNKTWIPLHRSIQKLVFENDIVENGIHKIDKLSKAIYRLSWAVFKKRAFSEYDVEILRASKNILISEKSYHLLYEIFYKYTETLCNHIKNDEFDVIIKDYFDFYKY